MIPVYNRERFVGRALNSCLLQGFEDFEVIVVDDASTDESVPVVRQYTDSRIRLILHDSNLGVFAARNSGIQAAQGDWVLCLDSDDELTPGALSVIYEKAIQVSDDIAGLRFMCLMDNGQLSPRPPLRPEVWGYEGYVTWAESVCGGLAETLIVVRRSTFERVKYPDGRGGEFLYHLDFARRFVTRQFPVVVRRYHQDADNQLTTPDPVRLVAEAPRRARHIQKLLAAHGSALAELAPRRHSAEIFKLAFHQFLSGWREEAVRNAGRCLRQSPFLLRAWAIVPLGLLGPKVLAWIVAKRASMRRTT